MAQRYRITCIEKNDRFNRYERILSIGVIDEFSNHLRFAQWEAITKIELFGDKFFVIHGRYQVEVEVALSPYQHKYLRTKADQYDENNLLNLPECVFA